MRFPVLAGLLAVVLLLPASSVAAQQRDNPLIGQGQQLYDELRFEEALQVLSAALVRSGNTREQEATIYRLLAFTYLALGREEEAEGAYRNLLAIQPDFEPGRDLSPRFREFFAGVEGRWVEDGRPGIPPPAPVGFEHTSPPRAERGEPVRLEATLDDTGDRVAQVVLAYRRGSEDVFQRIEANREQGRYVATLPAKDVTPPLVEYYFEALDEQGLPIASQGDVAAPLRITVPAPEKGSIFGQWWFWVAAAAAVGAGVTAGVLLAGDGGGGSQPGTLRVIITE